MADDGLRSEILTIHEFGDQLISLSIIYEEADSGAATGQLFATPLDRAKRSGKPARVLITNDTLRCFWISPEGSMWVASADGNVGTNAAVRWPAPQRGDLTYTSSDSSSKWVVTTLPAIKSTGLRPDITTLWGTSDSDIHVGTTGGHLYRWDGTAWTQTFEGPGKGGGTIRAIDGHGPENVFAVGLANTALHFDGARWQPVRVPSVPGNAANLTGIFPQAGGAVLISGASNDGVLLHGTAQGLTEFGRYPIKLIDMAGSGERVLFATGDGVAELVGHEVKMIRSTFLTATMTAGKGRWFFIEPAQERPSFVEYLPSDEKSPWKRYKY